MTDSRTGFSEAVLAAAARLPEVELTTCGRKTGKPHRTTAEQATFEILPAADAAS